LEAALILLEHLIIVDAQVYNAFGFLKLLSLTVRKCLVL